MVLTASISRRWLQPDRPPWPWWPSLGPPSLVSPHICTMSTAASWHPAIVTIAQRYAHRAYGRCRAAGT